MSEVEENPGPSPSSIAVSDMGSVNDPSAEDLLAQSMERLVRFLPDTVVDDPVAAIIQLVNDLRAEVVHLRSALATAAVEFSSAAVGGEGAKTVSPRTTLPPLDAVLAAASTLDEAIVQARVAVTPDNQAELMVQIAAGWHAIADLVSSRYASFRPAPTDENTSGR